MEANGSFVLAILIGMVVLLLVLVFGIVIFRALFRRTRHSPPLIPSHDGHYDVVGKRVTCSHCGNNTFKSQEILLNTWLLSLLRIDWLDSSATVLSCDKCGRLNWFAQEEATDD